jgi:hypothetical protein
MRCPNSSRMYASRSNAESASSSSETLISVAALYAFSVACPNASSDAV